MNKRASQAISAVPLILALGTGSVCAQTVAGASPASAGAPNAKPVTPIAPLTVDLRYPDGFAVRMPHGAFPFKSS